MKIEAGRAWRLPNAFAIALLCGCAPSRTTSPPRSAAERSPAPAAPSSPVVPLAASALPALLVAARKATGGDAWDRVQVIESKWSVAVSGLTGTLDQIEDVAHGRSRDELRVGPIHQLEGVDDKGGWGRAPGGEVLRRDAPEAIARTRTRAWMTRRGYLRPDGTPYRELPVRDDHGRRLHGLEASPEGGLPVELWFDDAGHLTRTSQRLSMLVVVTDFSDFRDVEGLQLPFRAVVDQGDPRNRATLGMTEVHLRPALPESTFAPPETDLDRLQFTGGGHSSELGFDLINNHIYVNAMVDGQPVRMLLDTGGANLLTRAAAARLGLKPQGEAALNGGGEGQVSTGVVHGKTLQLGEVVLAKPIFYVIDPGPFIGSDGEDLDGLIGYEMFSRLAVQIDYSARRVTLTAPAAFAPPARATAVPFDVSFHIPIVRGTIDGIPGRFWIDTGWRMSLTTMSKFTRDHDLATKYHAQFETMTGWGINGPLRTRPVRFHEVTIGGITVRDAVGGLSFSDKGALADPDAAAIIGTGILGRFVVTFDYASRTMYLEPGKAIAAREIYDRSGLFLLRTDDGRALRVAAVAPTGPAEHAGVHAEDRITAIDGAPVETRRLWQWRAELRDRAPGTRVRLHIERTGAAAHDVIITLAELVP